MDETLKFIHGEAVAKVYEALKNDLQELDKKYTELKDINGKEIKASSFYSYTIEPTNLMFNDPIPNDLKQDVIALFDKHLKPKGN